jgi:hypothetical protein
MFLEGLLQIWHKTFPLSDSRLGTTAGRHFPVLDSSFSQATFLHRSKRGER